MRLKEFADALEDVVRKRGGGCGENGEFEKGTLRDCAIRVPTTRKSLLPISLRSGPETDRRKGTYRALQSIDDPHDN
jgi:hypothetical protein